MTATIDRLMTLEIRSAQQDQTIEELSGQLSEQWTVIERLQKSLVALTDRFAEIEDQARPETPITRPPHW